MFCIRRRNNCAVGFRRVTVEKTIARGLRDRSGRFYFRVPATRLIFLLCAARKIRFAHVTQSLYVSISPTNTLPRRIFFRIFTFLVVQPAHEKFRRMFVLVAHFCRGWLRKFFSRRNGICANFRLATVAWTKSRRQIHRNRFAARMAR